jgi:hypothetical protein
VNNEKLFNLLKIVEVPALPRFKSKFASAKQYFSKETGLQIVTANEETTTGWHLCVWHNARMPTVNDMRFIKEALIPDNVTVAIPLGTPSEMHSGMPFMVHANEIFAINHNTKTND